MKTIQVKIPNKEDAQNYRLIHKDTHYALLKYLNKLPEWVEEGGLECWVSEVYNELLHIRSLR